MRKPLIAGNWKMYKTISEASSLIGELKKLVADVNSVDIVVAPVFTALTTAVAAASGTDIQIAAQDCYWENEGAYTGEIAPKMLKDVGCSYVIIGHSERRQYFAETNESVNRKLKAAISEGLAVIMCVGETLSERESDLTFKVVEEQLRRGLSNVSPSELIKVVIAYEPVWAIGTGKTATDEQAQEVHEFIRKLLSEMYCDSQEAKSVRILYGGSVKPENIASLMSCPDIDGALVGGASLKAELFANIVKFKK